MKLSLLLRSVPLALTLFAVASPPSAHAGSATWNLNPVDNNWNNPANWTPQTVPNGPTDLARFSESSKTDLVFSAAATEVAEIVFTPGASSFTITASPAATQSEVTLTISGAGITNNSGVTQTLTAGPPVIFDVGMINFRNSATGGEGTALNALASDDQGSFPSSQINFYDTSSAGNASIYAEGARGDLESYGAEANFYNNATAGNASCIVSGSFQSGSYGAQINFFDDSSAGNGIFTVEGPSNGGFFGGEVLFYGNSEAGTALLMAFNGGTIGFVGGDGGQARIQLFDSGTLDLTFFNSTDVTVGSIEGEDGLILLAYIFGSHKLTVGSNNLSTTFSGEIQGDGFLDKIGTGTLTLKGANSYSENTTISSGTLLVSNSSGSGTGFGGVYVNAGTLGGKGIIAGAVTVGTGGGTGAFLAPALGPKKQSTLRIQSALTFKSDAIYTFTFRAKGTNARSDQVIANGVTINSGAFFAFQGTVQGVLPIGLSLTAIKNTSASPIGGTFSNLPDGGILTVNGNNFQANYEGGDGNDLTLTVVP
jgi:autotransporter-associated beta strand protein